MRTEEAARGWRHRPWRWIGLGTGAAALLIALAGAGYWHVAAQARVGEYRARAELLAWTFQDRVSFDLKQGNEQDLEFLTGTLVLGNVLYAQIVVDGRVLAEVNRLDEPLSPLSPSPEKAGESGAGTLTIERRVTAQGRAYWDIRRALPDQQGYVRLGLSLEPLERELRAQLWLTLGTGLGAVALVGLVLAVLLLRSPSLREPRTAGVPAESESSAAAAVSAPWRRIGDLALDLEGKRVTIRGCPVELSPKEFELLALLASEPGRVFSNPEILEHVWADSHYASSQDVKQYIYFLRQKLERDPRNPERILTVRGFGYKLQG